jgi:acetate kinase
MTPQSGVFHNNRVGEFDIFAMQRLAKHGHSLDDVLVKLSKESGLLGISGVSNDLRDVLAAAAANANASAGATPTTNRAQLAIDAFVESVRHYVGAALVALGGCDVLAFTGGIGENAPQIREAVCRNLDFAGIALDPAKNHARGREERVSALESDAEIWVIPANEELIVARQTRDVLSAN